MIILLITFILGVLTGILLYRNNIKKSEKVINGAEEVKAKGKFLLDILKGRNK
ncbi:hypothetical protein UFOVP144_56 [uncultured Caudovirales phage]|uniref:Uncharacterized protein n=1 Tax=uncultured Caudovirales phage TaxID=2100421 RepID=A0A6J7XM97_9CAUD|nr:hypothetical protein UFOVP144_56 [uncultured Caudovirales phage]